MTNSVLKFTGSTRSLSLKEAYIEGIISGWNAQIDVGHIDFPAVRTMTGYLMGATVAFRVTGDETNALLVEATAKNLLDNWRDSDRCIRQLVIDLCAHN